MAYNRNYDYNQMNTGLGLIYRLNNAMRKIEEAVEAGRYEKWNILIDRMYANLMYKNPMEVLTDDAGKILDIKLKDIDKLVYSAINKKVSEAFKAYALACKIKKDVEFARTALYNRLMKKEMWIKKKMFELGIYLKEASDDPGAKMWGG